MTLAALIAFWFCFTSSPAPAVETLAASVKRPMV